MKNFLPGFAIFFAGFIQLSWMNPGEETHTRISFPAFDIIFHNDSASELDPEFQIDTANLELVYNPADNEYNDENYSAKWLRAKADTTAITFFDQDIDNSLIEIIPGAKKGKYVLSYCLYETIQEQYDPRIKRTAKEDSIWFANRLHCERWSPFFPVKDSAELFFRPVMNYRAADKEMKKALHLHDTLIDLSGESANIATIIYKGKPCTYDYPAILLRVQRLEGKKIAETKFVRIWLEFDD